MRMGRASMNIDPQQLLLLLNWMSPAFPTGAFAYSHGLEQAIADGRLRDARAVQEWIADVICHGSGWNDAVLFARCWKDSSRELNELALALASSKERYEETLALGRSFGLAAAAWGADSPADDAAHPIAAARACIDMEVERETAMLAYLNTFSQSLVSCAVRLVPLGQSAGLEVLCNLAPIIAATASRACEADLGDLGTASIAADIAAMKHETLEPRIFRT
jgi:urease accessory protein